MNEPDSDEIGKRQNEDRNVRRQAAARRFYARSKHWYLLGSAVAVALALAAPILLFLAPSAGPALGAIAGAWIFAAQLLLDPISASAKRRGALTQEMFDCDVLGLEWNAMTGRRVSEEEIRSASPDSIPNGIRDWYPVGDTPKSWPTSILVCQRANAVWSRRQHIGYGWFLLAVAVGWFLVSVVVATLADASLIDYLATIALPSLPAWLTAAERSKSQFMAASIREEMQDCIETLMKDGATAEDLRGVQDQMFKVRSTGPLVPDWYYRIVKDRFERDMRYAAKHT